MKTRLIAKSTTGKTKFIELETAGGYLITRWGYEDGKIQETKEFCEAKNVGKANATTAEEQAIEEFERKKKKKIDEGYSEGKLQNKQSEIPNLSNLQKHFCPCKPISKPPKDALNGSYVCERKYNGVNIILTKDNDGNGHLYTRRIEDITENLLWIPELQDHLKKMKNESMILIELVYITNMLKEQPEKLRGLINSRRSREDVEKHRDEIILNGQITPIVFDVMFWASDFVGNRTFVERRAILNENQFKNLPDYSIFKQKSIEYARKHNWEGFILRYLDGKLEYSMNGKATRTGSWKWKFEKTDDFVVVAAEVGKGKHSGYFARFKLAQYDPDGKLMDCGYCGPGKITVEELKILFQERSDIDGNYMVDPYLVIEVLYRARTDDGKLEFPVFQRVRDDKRPEDCIYEG